MRIVWTHRAVAGHERGYIVAVAHEDVGEAVLAHHYYPIVAQLTGAAAKDTIAGEDIQTLRIRAECPRLHLRSCTACIQGW